MEIQQHDNVVVEVAGFQQGFTKRCRRREMCHGREREAPGLRLGYPPFPPTIYRAKGEGEGAALPLPPRKGAARGESFPPKAPRRCLPPLGLSLLSYLLRMGLLGWCP